LVNFLQYKEILACSFNAGFGQNRLAAHKVAFVKHTLRTTHTLERFEHMCLEYGLKQCGICYSCRKSSVTTKRQLCTAQIIRKVIIKEIPSCFTNYFFPRKCVVLYEILLDHVWIFLTVCLNVIIHLINYVISSCF